MIFVNITTLEIIKQFSATRDHLKQATSGVVVLFVDLEMLGQFVYALRQQRDLYLRRTCVRPVGLVVAYYLIF